MQEAHVLILADKICLKVIQSYCIKILPYTVVTYLCKYNWAERRLNFAVL